MSPPSSQGNVTKSLEQFGLDLLIGGTAAAIAKTSCAPLERTKLLLQVNTNLLLQVRQHGKTLKLCAR